MDVCERIVIKTPKKPLIEIERSIIKTYRKELFRPFVKAICDYQLIEENDKIAVAVSGGKDSLLLAKLFQALKRHQKFHFEVVFIAMNPGFLDVNLNQLKENCQYLDIPIHIKDSNIFHVVEKIAYQHPCYLCARMRRGFLYEQAKALGCNKLALGHHFDDVIETTLLNVFYAGQFKTMVPKIKSENFENMTLIRPLVLVKEKDIIRFIKNAGIQCMNCGCTVAALKTASKRREIKQFIETMRKSHKDFDLSIFSSATNINLDAVYGYQKQGRQVSFNDIFRGEDNDS